MKKQDRRKARTRQWLYKALLELIEEKGMEGVTVSKLTERAGVNRGTFYLHFRDPSDMLNQYKMEVLDGLARELDRIDPFELQRYAGKNEPYPVSLRVLEYIDKHADFFRVMFGPKGDISFLMQIKEFMKNKMSDYFSKNFPQTDRALVPRDYAIAYVVSGNLGLLAYWFETGRRLPPAEIARMVTRILSDGPLASIGLKE